MTARIPIQRVYDKRKDGMGFPARYTICSDGMNGHSKRTASFINGSMTVETAVVLPLFLFLMLTMLQIASLITASSALLAGMQETAKDLAVYAYVQDIGVSAGDSLAADLVVGSLSAVYAKGRIEELAGPPAEDGTFSLLESSFLTNEMIDLAGTYRKNRFLSPLPTLGVKTVVRARVRAWTGREGRPVKSDTDGDVSNNQEKGPKVYVTETGTVYHKDPNCTHIKLSVSMISKSELSSRRNKYGARYHSCEKCGAAAGDMVYISGNGTRYHSSPECSGIKRTVHECYLSDVEGMHACSRCGGGG